MQENMRGEQNKGEKSNNKMSLIWGKDVYQKYYVVALN